MPTIETGRPQGMDATGVPPSGNAESAAARSPTTAGIRPFPMPGKNLGGGALMVLIGLFALMRGLSYEVGTLTAMGPGFFPAALGVILMVIGIAIAVTGRSSGAGAGIEGDARAPQWRGWFCISLGIVSFVVLGRYGGLLPATFAIVFISALGDRSNSIRDALVLALGIVAICIVVFWWALQLQLPLVKWG